MDKQLNKADSNLHAAYMDWDEAKHYVDGARRRARRTAKREARRAARRMPIEYDNDEYGDEGRA